MSFDEPKPDDAQLVSEGVPLIVDPTSFAYLDGSAIDFEAYVAGPARDEHDRIIEEAEALGVFGVPTMVFNDELFWGGDRIDMLIERIRNPESIATALGSRHHK